MSCLHEGDARDAASRQRKLELKLDGAGVDSLEHVQEPVLRPGDEEEAGVVELQRAHLAGVPSVERCGVGQVQRCLCLRSRAGRTLAAKRFMR